MSKQAKALIALLVVIGLSSIAYAQFSSEVFIPLVMSDADPRTATPTPTQSPDVQINFIETGGESPPDNFWEEYVRVKNRTPRRVELTDWKIWSKRNRKTYTFPEFELKSNQTVRVWTRPGTDTDTDLFWGLENEVWKDDGDCAKLIYEDGELAGWYYYPGDDCEW
jgi:hypothetical protein